MSWMYRIFQRDNNETYIKSAIPIIPANTASGNTIMGQDGIIVRDIADGTTANQDVVLTFKCRVIDAWFVCVGATAPSSGDTVLISNGANAISAAVAMGTTARATVRIATMDDTYTTIVAGGTLRITPAASGNNNACSVYVRVLPVA